MKTYIKNARVVLEHEILEEGAIIVEEERIVAVGRHADMAAPDDALVIDAEGNYVGPGFVDLHVHGGGQAMLYAEPEKASRHFLEHGETTILAALYYDLSKEQFLHSVRCIKRAMECGNAPNLAGIYMEGPYMNPKYGASPEKNKWRAKIDRNDYQEIVDAAGTLAKIWVIAPERDSVARFVQYAKAVHPHAVISVGHSEATPEQVRAFQPYGLMLQTHCMNATGRMGKRGGVRGCGPDEACLLDDDMYAEIICDSRAIHVKKDMLRLLLKVKGVGKLVLITDSFESDELPPEDLREVPDLMFDANGGLSGSKLTMEMACRNMIGHTSCSVPEVFRMASLNPARVLRMDGEIGSICAGKRADMVFVDCGFNVKTVMKNGNVLV